jgi:L-rhamnose mutarotase
MKNRTFCFALDLVDDAELIAQYERWHAPGAVWPEVIEDIRARGIVGMEIWRIGTRMVMVVEADESFPRAQPQSPRTAEWETLMSKYQRQLPDANPAEKWAPMTRVFALNSDTDP